MTMQRLAPIVGLLLLASACRSSSPAGPATPPGDETAAKAAPEPIVPETWAEATAAGMGVQVAFMQSRVVAAMKPKFTAAGNEFENFSCATCHGPDNQDPHAYLPPLTMKDGQISEFVTKPEASMFMAETIVPAMAGAMGEEPFDPATGQGFGCAGCHSITEG